MADANSTRTSGTRTLDIIHVASAFVLEAEAFLTFDERQRKVGPSREANRPVARKAARTC